MSSGGIASDWRTTRLGGTGLVERLVVALGVPTDDASSYDGGGRKDATRRLIPLLLLSSLAVADDGPGAPLAPASIAA